MQSDADRLFHEAVKLPDDEREALAEHLYLSLHSSGDSAEGQTPADVAWNDEIARRVAEIKSGAAQTVSAEDIHRELRKSAGE